LVYADIACFSAAESSSSALIIVREAMDLLHHPNLSHAPEDIKTKVHHLMPMALSICGGICMENGQVHEAITWYEEGLSLTASDLTSHASFCSNLSDSYLSIGKVTEALVWARKQHDIRSKQSPLNEEFAASKGRKDTLWRAQFRISSTCGRATFCAYLCCLLAVAYRCIWCHTSLAAVRCCQSPRSFHFRWPGLQRMQHHRARPCRSGARAVPANLLSRQRSPSQFSLLRYGYSKQQKR
jgi:hypothetical protein